MVLVKDGTREGYYSVYLFLAPWLSFHAASLSLFQDILHILHRRTRGTESGYRIMLMRISPSPTLFLEGWTVYKRDGLAVVFLFPP